MSDAITDVRAIANEVAKTTRCFCDLDNWTPEPDTGHSWVCPIHEDAMRRYYLVRNNLTAPAPSTASASESEEK